MKNVMSIISVKLDNYDKGIADDILKKLGLNMSTYINMAIKQLIINGEIPFEIINPEPNKELLEAINEGEDILSGKIETKGYHNVRKMFDDILNEV